MHIGFDAKRAFHNRTGLGVYSRSLIRGLAESFPEHRYTLFNPKSGDAFSTAGHPNLEEVQPNGTSAVLPQWWRRYGIVKEIKRRSVELYHGLSAELPAGIRRTGAATVVTIHDLIYERYPLQYGPINVALHRAKAKAACRDADRIIAISQQTARDLQALYGIGEDRIEVCYQSCDPTFDQPRTAEQKAALRQAYRLPESFVLYVGSIIERKNLLRICEAYSTRPAAFPPLVVVGNGGGYAKIVRAYIQHHHLSDRVRFLSDQMPADPALSIVRLSNLATLYSCASAFVYPSVYEGFGIPVLEALKMGVPTITSRGTSMEEIGGNSVVLVDPLSKDELAMALRSVLEDTAFSDRLRRVGAERASLFSSMSHAQSVMNVYNKLL